MPNLVTYLIENVRATAPSGKVAEANPERLLTVSGTFYATDTDAKGNLVQKEKLSFASKNIDKDDATAEGFAFDPVNGILTMAQGTRGRTRAEGLAVDDITAILASAREAASA